MAVTAESSAKHFLVTFPPEITRLIFDHVPPRKIICDCRLVSKDWRSFLDEPYFWQRRMSQRGNFSQKLLSLKDIQWSMLYMNTVYRPNLLRVVHNQQLTLDVAVWNILYQDWDTFKKGRHLIDRVNVGLHRYRVGDGWDIESDCIGEDLVRLREENEGCKQNYVTTYYWCCKERIVDLHSMGFTQELLDEVQPSIVVSEWFAARDDCGSLYNLHVALLDHKYQVVETYDFQETTPQWLGGSLGWRRVEHTFADYGKGVMYVRFAHGGKDTQFWAGHYGSKMAGSQIRVVF